MGPAAILRRGWLDTLLPVGASAGNTAEPVVRLYRVPPLLLAVSARLGLLPADFPQFGQIRAGQRIQLQEGRDIRWSGPWIARTDGLLISRLFALDEGIAGLCCGVLATSDPPTIAWFAYPRR